MDGFGQHRSGTGSCRAGSGRARLLLLVPVMALGLVGCATRGETDGPQAVAVDPHADRPQPPELPLGAAIVGMESGQVASLLGEPALQRREQPAQYWRYSYAGCTLDLFLYRHPESGRMHVLYYELRQEPRPAAFRNERCAGMAARLGPNSAGNGGELPEVASH
jgi:hypothetical protein